MSGEGQPRMLILAGPNGAGKTTLSSTLLAGENAQLHFLNADIEARKLSPNDVSSVAVQAGRTVLKHMRENLRMSRSFAIETTLSGRAHLKLIARAVSAGWTVELYFLWLKSIELAYERVAVRVETGGHDIPRDVIARRYTRGLRMLPVYCREVSHWTIIDNSGRESDTVAWGSDKETQVLLEDEFEAIRSCSGGDWQ